jgi:hypothetical protein
MIIITVVCVFVCVCMCPHSPLLVRIKNKSLAFKLFNLKNIFKEFFKHRFRTA